MVLLEKMKLHTVASGNYVTSVHGMLHPDRILKEHDFLYILDGTWEIREDGVIYQLHSDDLLILAAGRHHYGLEMCNPGNRHMYIHVLPTARKNSITRLTPQRMTCPERKTSCSPIPVCCTVSRLPASGSISRI